MRAAAACLPGRRDFSVFAVRLTRGESGVRDLERVEIEEAGAELRALFRGDGFLRGMVRSIAACSPTRPGDASRPGRTAELLRTGDRGKLSAKAAARGLTLVRVEYGR